MTDKELRKLKRAELHEIMILSPGGIKQCEAGK